MKTTQCNTKRVLRNAAIACACICFPAVMQAHTVMDVKIAAENAAIAAENEKIQQSSMADFAVFTAVTGEKPPKQNKKRRRHRRITHVR
ncbi:MAG: hypothetical protein LBU90_07940 [Bacteroidales bacterium]|jgi:hypothetical protein|nr:hypothetical protein [Bacteroidales bacterium]